METLSQAIEVSSTAVISCFGATLTETLAMFNRLHGAPTESFGKLVHLLIRFIVGYGVINQLTMRAARGSDPVGG